MKKLEGKAVILTGASGGLGKQMAIKFAEEGANLAICARKESKLEETAGLCKEAGADVVAFVCDISDYSKLVAFTDKAVGRFGRVDALVNNAVSIAPPHPFLDHDVSTLDSTMKSGLYATWHLMKLSFPYLKKQGGAVLNFGSGAGYLGMEGYAAYAATKEAIRALSRVAAREWGVYGIRVNVLSPSSMTDNIRDGTRDLPAEIKDYVSKSLSTNALHRVGDAYGDIAPAALFLISDDSKFITGQDLRVEGGGIVSA